jgi:hypothetical protein
MNDKQEFIDAMDIQQDEDGHWFVNGHVEGNVNGYVEGYVRHVEGNVQYVGGNVIIVRGDVEEHVGGNVRHVVGDVGRVEGDVMGSVKGSVWGSVKGDVYHRVYGNVGKVDGRRDIENDTELLEAEVDRLKDLLNQAISHLDEVVGVGWCPIIAKSLKRQLEEKE